MLQNILLLTIICYDKKLISPIWSKKFKRLLKVRTFFIQKKLNIDSILTTRASLMTHIIYLNAVTMSIMANGR
jgi:hypothetical protein